MTYNAAILPIVDAIAGLLTLPTDMTVDGTGAGPVLHRPDTLYVWPRIQLPKFATTYSGDESQEEVTFGIRVAWAVSGEGEEGGQTRLREVSDALDAGVKEVMDMVRANRNSSLWEQMQVDLVTYDAVVTFEVRAAWIDISGYRLTES